jgi:hypothetical protein
VIGVTNTNPSTEDVLKSVMTSLVKRFKTRTSTKLNDKIIVDPQHGTKISSSIESRILWLRNLTEFNKDLLCNNNLSVIAL